MQQTSLIEQSSDPATFEDAADSSSFVDVVGDEILEATATRLSYTSAHIEGLMRTITEQEVGDTTPLDCGNHVQCSCGEAFLHPDPDFHLREFEPGT